MVHRTRRPSAQLNKCQTVQRRLSIAIDTVSKSHQPNTLRLTHPNLLLASHPSVLPSHQLVVHGASYGGQRTVDAPCQVPEMRLIVILVITVEIQALHAPDSGLVVLQVR